MRPIFIITRLWNTTAMYLKSERVKDNEFKTWSSLFKSAQQFTRRSEAIETIQAEKFPYPVEIKKLWVKI